MMNYRSPAWNEKTILPVGLKLREFSGVDLFKPKVRLINLKIKVIISLGAITQDTLYPPLLRHSVLESNHPGNKYEAESRGGNKGNSVNQTMNAHATLETDLSRWVRPSFINLLSSQVAEGHLVLTHQFLVSSFGYIFKYFEADWSLYHFINSQHFSCWMTIFSWSYSHL